MFRFCLTHRHPRSTSRTASSAWIDGCPTHHECHNLHVGQLHNIHEGRECMSHFGSSHFCSNTALCARVMVCSFGFLLLLLSAIFWDVEDGARFWCRRGGCKSSDHAPSLSNGSCTEGREAPATTTVRSDGTVGPLAPAARQWSSGAATGTEDRATEILAPKTRLRNARVSWNGPGRGRRQRVGCKPRQS